jgi:hypothetical protein
MCYVDTSFQSEDFYLNQKEEKRGADEFYVPPC